MFLLQFCKICEFNPCTRPVSSTHSSWSCGCLPQLSKSWAPKGANTPTHPETKRSLNVCLLFVSKRLQTAYKQVTNGKQTVKWRQVTCVYKRQTNVCKQANTTHTGNKRYMNSWLGRYYKRLFHVFIQTGRPPWRRGSDVFCLLLYNKLKTINSILNIYITVCVLNVLVIHKKTMPQNFSLHLLKW